MTKLVKPGFQPSSHYGTCPCCGSILRWEVIHTMDSYLADSPSPFSGDLQRIDVRHIYALLEHMRIYGTATQDNTVKALTSMTTMLLNNALNPMNVDPAKLLDLPAPLEALVEKNRKVKPGP